MKVEKDTKVVHYKWYSEVKVLPKELLRTWFLYKGRKLKELVHSYYRCGVDTFTK